MRLEGELGASGTVPADAVHSEPTEAAAPAAAEPESKAEEAAPVAAAAAPVAAASASEETDQFHEAPVASEKETSKAVDGAEKADAKDLAVETNGNASGHVAAEEEKAPVAARNGDDKKMSMTRRFSRSIKSKIMA